jgi:hypothetical protein
MDPRIEKLESYIKLAQQYPVLSGALLGALLWALATMLFLLAAGTICSYLDDTKASVRGGALIRLGRKWGIVLRSSGRDLLLAVLGESALVMFPDEPAGSGSAPAPDDKR